MIKIFVLILVSVVVKNKQSNTMTTVSFFTKNSDGFFGGKIQLIPNPGTIETINYALNSYGFLINIGENISPAQFITHIKDAYDCESNPQNRAVIAALSCLI